MAGQARHRPLRRPARRLVTAGGVAVAVGLASLIGVEGLTGGSGRSGLILEVSPAAAAQLDRVARAAAAQPGLDAGQWEYVERDQQSRSGSNASTMVRVQDWFSATGVERERITTAGAVTSDTMYTDPSSTSAPTPGVNETSPASDVQALLSDITAAAPASMQNVSPATYPAYYWVDLSNVLLTSTSPSLRSLAFSALKYLPGASVLGSQTDSSGRTGVAISYDGGPGNTTGIDESYTIIVSPTTGQLLESFDTLTGPSGGMPTGTVVYRVTNSRQGIVGADTALPGGGTLPLGSSSTSSTTTTATQAVPATARR